MFGGNFAPAGWAFCSGQLIPISENETLFNLIGTIYGGDGQNTFALPDLQSRVPVHMGTGGAATYTIGESGGTETVTLTNSQIPAHSHVPNASSSPGVSDSPAGNVWAAVANGLPYSNAAPSVSMNAAAIGSAGGSQPHENMIPYVAINFIISLFGVFPSQT